MKCFLTFATLLIVYTSHASIVYVDVDASPLFPNGNSWNQAFDNMEDAWEAASPGDQIWVAEGSYASAHRAMRIGNGIHVYCGFHGWETQLSQRDWQNNHCVFTQFLSNSNYDVVISCRADYGPATALVDGAYFSNWGYIHDQGSIIVCGSSDSIDITIRNCSFSVIDAGGPLFYKGTYNPGCEIHIENCNFHNVIVGDKACNNWAGMTFEYEDCSFTSTNFGEDPDEWTFKNSSFVNTFFKYCGMPAFGGSGCELNSCLIEGCLFYSENSSAWHNSDLVNCTIVENDCGKRLCANVDVFNTIFYGNSSYEDFNLLDNNQVAAYNCILEEDFDGTSFNSFVAYPEFVDAPNGDWCLSQCSPAIDNTGLSQSEYPEDLKGNPRVANGELDMGCYEFQGASKRIIYVDDDASGANDGSSWANAFNKLHDAIAARCDISDIWVAHGNYYPNANPGNPSKFATISVPNGTRIYGGFEGDELFFSERNLQLFNSGNRAELLGTNGTATTTDDAYNIVVIETGAQDVVIDGLYFGYGKAIGVGSFGAGGAIRTQNSHAEIRNCRFEANTAVNGGALSIAGAADIDIYHCQFEFNSASTQGGAINCGVYAGLYPELTIDRTWFLMNSAAQGGGIYSDGSVSAYNSLFNSNSASFAGDGIVLFGTMELLNCTMYDHGSAVEFEGDGSVFNCNFWNNDSDLIYNPNVDNVDVEYCNLSSPGFGGSNISEDPLFVNALGWDFGLSLGSPCINEGFNGAVIGELDRAGLNRISDGDVDLGALEFSVPCDSSNDLCDNASDIDVSVSNTVYADMECATAEGDIIVSTCGIDGAKSVWYHFVMPNHKIEFYLGDEPDDTYGDRVLSVFRGSCEYPIGSLCGQYLLIGPNYIEPGEDVFIKLTHWYTPETISFNINPIIPVISSVVPLQQSDCESDYPSSTYYQQIGVTYDNTETYSQMEVNGTFFDLTGSPQYIVLEDIIANGQFMDIEVRILESSTIFTMTDFVETPCCEPKHDHCGDPFPMELGETAISQLDCATQGVDDILSSCTTNPGMSLWFEFPAPSSGTAKLECDIVELNGPFNVRMSVWDITDGCADAVEVGCINQLGDNQDESGEVGGLTPGQWYLVMVSGYESQKGTFSLTINEVEATCNCAPDFNGDCQVTSADLLIFLSGFGCTSGCTVDLTDDDQVNASDLLEFLTYYGESCQ